MRKMTLTSGVDIKIICLDLHCWGCQNNPEGFIVGVSLFPLLHPDVRVSSFVVQENTSSSYSEGGAGSAPGSGHFTP